MLLSCRVLTNVLSVNSFEYASAAEFTEGDTPTVYIQLLDMSEDKAIEGFAPAGRRYMPSAGASLQITMDNVDSAKRVVRSATQPFPQDPSIWRFDILPTDKIRGTITLRLQLSEGARTTKGSLKAGMLVSSAR